MANVLVKPSAWSQIEHWSVTNQSGRRVGKVLDIDMNLSPHEPIVCITMRVALTREGSYSVARKMGIKIDNPFSYDSEQHPEPIGGT